MSVHPGLWTVSVWTSAKETCFCGRGACSGPWGPWVLLGSTSVAWGQAGCWLQPCQDWEQVDTHPCVAELPLQSPGTSTRETQSPLFSLLCLLSWLVHVASRGLGIDPQLYTETHTQTSDHRHAGTQITGTQSLPGPRQSSDTPREQGPGCLRAQAGRPQAARQHAAPEHSLGRLARATGGLRVSRGSPGLGCQGGGKEEVGSF